jgi:hypothetical protein
LPTIAATLSATGAGPCTLVGPVELTTDIRVAYDPECWDTVEEARAEGRPWQMRWDSIGPPSADNAATYYRSCGGIHRTWAMTDITGAVVDESLRPLIEASKVLTRKRVAITYTLHNPGVAAGLAQEDVNAAQWRLNTSHNPVQKLDDNRLAAGVTAAHQSKGAGVVDVSLAVTCTILDPDRPPRDGETPEDLANRPNLNTVNAVVGSIGPAARLLLRPEDYTQAFAFACTLPGIGLRPALFSRVPGWLRGTL